MSQNRILLSISTVLILVVSVGRAAGAEAPFYKVSGERVPLLRLGHTPMTAVHSFRLRTSKVTITCRALKFSLFFQGEFEQCRVRGNGDSCKLKGGRFVTSPVMSVFGFEHPNASGKLLTVTMPVGADSAGLPRLFEHHNPEAQSSVSVEPPPGGERLAQLGFVGSGCDVGSADLDGSFAAENVVRGKVVESGLNEAEAPDIVENLPSEPIAAVFVEEDGGMRSLKVGLDAFGEVAVLEGAAEVLLAGGQEWGIFSREDVPAARRCQSWTALSIDFASFCWP